MDANEPGNTVRFSLRISHLLIPGTYDMNAPGRIGMRARFGVCTDDDFGVRIACGDTDFSSYWIDRNYQAMLTITEFGIASGSHITGSIDADLEGGSSDLGLTSGRITGNFDFIIP